MICFMSDTVYFRPCSPVSGRKGRSCCLGNICFHIPKDNQEIVPVAEVRIRYFAGSFGKDFFYRFQRVFRAVEYHFGSGVLQHVPYPVHDRYKADFFFCLVQYENQMALDGGERLYGLVDKGGNTAVL